MFEGKTILITGGTGSLGKSLTSELIKHNPAKVIIFSRDEYKQSEMQKTYNHECIRYFIGDVRDYERLVEVLCLNKVNFLIHAAALKQVPAMEYNPTEAVKTNILGSMNVIRACIEANVEMAIGVSTDKAVNPINLYGSTKLTMEKLFIAANAYNKTKFSCVRYGNVIGSRGSVVELYQELKNKGIKEFPVTELNMTRFWITLKQAVNLVIRSFELMNGGEIYIPFIPSMRMEDLAKTIDSDCEIKIIGIRPGEKRHECLVSEDYKNVKMIKGYEVIDITGEYSSLTNDWYLSSDEFKELLNDNQ